MDINIGDKFLVPNRGSRPFYWNFEYDESVVEATVIDPSIGVTHKATKGVFWDNPDHGYLVLMQTGDGYFQWVPVGELRPDVNNKYKVGDVVVIKDNKYVGSICPVAVIGGLVYVTDVVDHGCQLSLVKDSHPDEHSDRSLFFNYGEFEPYKE